MKLLYLANVRLPTEKAHGLQIMKMCEALVANGVEVELVVPRRLNFSLGKINPFEYYSVAKTFKITRLPTLDLTSLNFGKFWGPFGFWLQTLTFSFSLVIYLLFKAADFIYSRDLAVLAVINYFSKKNTLIFEAHTAPKQKYKKVLARIKKIIVITQEIKKVLIGLQWNLPAEKIIVAPDAVDLRDFIVTESVTNCRKKLNLPSHEKIVLYAGHLYDWKGVYVLAAATRFFPDNVKTVFVGGLPHDVVALQRYVKQQGLKNIEIIGYRPPVEVPYFLKAADVLVLPNSARQLTWLYTSPMKLFEYLAAGKPIVASDLPAIREILNLNNSILVEPDNDQSLAEAIIKVLGNQSLAERISEQAITDVKFYTWNNRAEKIINFSLQK